MFNLPSLSREEDGFLKSFTINEKDEYTEFLKKYNFVILRILTEEEADESVDDFFNNVVPNVDRNDPSTWEQEFWPTFDKYLVGYATTQNAFYNRTHSNLHNAFSNIFGTDQLVSLIDRWGIMRPSRHRKEWRIQLEPHMDVNPWNYVGQLKNGLPPQYQGVLSLTDSYDHWCTTGGFRIVPGSANILDEWTSRFQDPTNGKGVSYHLTKNDPLYNKLQRIPLRKGEICIWDSGCVHANYCNTSESDFRIVQYVTMAPSNSPKSRIWSQWPSIFLKENKLDLTNMDLDSRQKNLLHF